VHVTTELRCAIETLVYPPAAFFALALAVINAPRRQVRGARTINTEVSGYDRGAALIQRGSQPRAGW
jgi:hypothetical protein